MSFDWQLHMADVIEGEKPVMIMMAGINGAGKSTFFEEYLECLGFPFLNADNISKERLGRHALTMEEGVKSSKAVSEEILKATQNSSSFVRETVFSDLGGHRLSEISNVVKEGYKVILCYIWLNSPELAEARVNQRVSQGGHDVERKKIATRYPRTLHNLKEAIPITDVVYVFDNSDISNQYRVMGVFSASKLIYKAGDSTVHLEMFLPKMLN